MENFVNAPHPQEVYTQNAKEENNCQSYTHITLECERICCGLRPAEQHCVRNAVAHHVKKADDNQLWRPRLKTDFVSVLKDVEDWQSKRHDVDCYHHPG